MLEGRRLTEGVGGAARGGAGGAAVDGVGLGGGVIDVVSGSSASTLEGVVETDPVTDFVSESLERDGGQYVISKADRGKSERTSPWL